MARILQISAKCSDMFCAALVVDGKQVGRITMGMSQTSCLEITLGTTFN